MTPTIAYCLVPLAFLLAFCALWRGLCWWMFGFDQARRAGLVATGPASTIPRPEPAVVPQPKPQPLSDFVSDIQCCPLCQRACNMEHVKAVDCPPSTRQSFVMLYCEDCDRGFEVVYRWVRVPGGGWWRRWFHRAYGPDNGRKFAGFKRRLGTAACTAA